MQDWLNTPSLTIGRQCTEITDISLDDSFLEAMFAVLNSCQPFLYHDKQAFFGLALPIPVSTVPHTSTQLLIEGLCYCSQAMHRLLSTLNLKVLGLYVESSSTDETLQGVFTLGKKQTVIWHPHDGILTQAHIPTVIWNPELRNFYPGLPAVSQAFISRLTPAPKWLVKCIMHHNTPPIDFLLCTQVCDVKTLDEEGNTALITAVVHRHADLVQVLINHGAEVDQKNSNHETPLLKAISRGLIDIVKVLLEQGAEVDQTNLLFNTALTTAASSKYWDIVETLIEYEVDINQVSERGITILTKAALGGDINSVKILIKQGAKVNQRCEDGGTALLGAALQGHVDVVQYLIEDCEADVNQADKYGHRSFKGNTFPTETLTPATEKSGQIC